jgi:hypothetical protein
MLTLWSSAGPVLVVSLQDAANLASPIRWLLLGFRDRAVRPVPDLAVAEVLRGAAFFFRDGRPLANGMAMRTLSELFPLIFPQFLGENRNPAGSTTGGKGRLGRLSADLLGILRRVQHGSKL